MIIYNLFPLLAGKFSEWEKHLERAAEMGFNWVFVNPIQKLGKSGSLYSISDYFSINPAFLDETSKKTPETQLQDVIKKAESLGLKVMVDLVLNHCAVDSHLVTDHPEWFLWDKGRIVNPAASEDGKRVIWKDLAMFDHRHTKDKEGLNRFLIRVLDYLIGLGFHGFRCDAAYQLPRGLWEKLIRETRSKHSDITFFAETLGCSSDETRKTAEAGFDYIFNSVKWWDFHGYWLMERYNLTRDMVPSIGFPESHDTGRLFEELYGNIEGMKQRYFFSALFSAGVMIPMGFEFCARKKLHVVKTTPQNWEETDCGLIPFIKKMNEIKSAHTIFQEDAPTAILPYHNPNVLFMWKGALSSSEEALIILNKDIWNRQVFYVDNLYNFVQSKNPLKDVSPEYPLDYLPTPFHYELRPGQGIVLVTRR
ncbi:MAG: alpha-amylase [Nitrospirales bacterium]|nr:alpha-amylase [Nitrospirales bacterium]